MATLTTALTPELVQSILNGPAGTPPVGVTPNFDNPPNTNRFVIITLVFCVLLASLAVLVRMYTKIFLIRSIEYEDYTLMIAWIGQIGETIPSALTTRHGCGVHIWNVRMKAFFRMLYWVNITAITYCLVMFFIKLSILLQYLRIFRPTRQGNLFLYLGVHACIWIIFLLYFLDIMFEVVMCVPREKIWNPLMTTGHCFDDSAAYRATGIFNVLSDFAILILPIPSVWRLKIPLRKKIGLVSVFSAGLFACAISIVRTYYTWKVTKLGDVSYNMIFFGLWTYAEISVGIIVTCLPISPRFFQFLGSKLSGTFSFRSKSGSKIVSKPESTGPNSNVKIPIKFQRPFTRESTSGAWNDSSSQHAHSQGEYSTLDEAESMSTVRGLTSQPVSQAQRQPDNTLESGY